MTAPGPDAYPTREEDATAERLCRSLVSGAGKRAARIEELVATAAPGTPQSRQLVAETTALVTAYGLVQALRAVTAENQLLADAIARQVWHVWEAGESEEFLFQWAAEYGQLAASGGGTPS